MKNIDVIKLVSKYDSRFVPYALIYSINKCNLHAVLNITSEVQHLSKHLSDTKALTYIEQNFKNFHLKSKNECNTPIFCFLFLDILEFLSKIRNREYGMGEIINFQTESFMAISQLLYSYYKENKSKIEYDFALVVYPLICKNDINLNMVNEGKREMRFKELTSCFLNLLATFIIRNNPDDSIKMCPCVVDVVHCHRRDKDTKFLTELQARKLTNMYNIIYKNIYMDMCIRGV